MNITTFGALPVVQPISVAFSLHPLPVQLSHFVTCAAPKSPAIFNLMGSAGKREAEGNLPELLLLDLSWVGRYRFYEPLLPFPLVTYHPEWHLL
jgi:hypothetical protein